MSLQGIYSTLNSIKLGGKQ